MKRAVTTLVISAALGWSAGTAAVHADPSHEQQVIDLTNQHRAAQGCGALTANAALTDAARGHSGDMAARNVMTHQGANGSDGGDRIAAAGYTATKWAENIASGHPTAREVVDSWMASPGHRANILDCGLTEVGVGHTVNAQGVPYWTQDFGTRG